MSGTPPPLVFSLKCFFIGIRSNINCLLTNQWCWQFLWKNISRNGLKVEPFVELCNYAKSVRGQKNKASVRVCVRGGGELINEYPWGILSYHREEWKYDGVNMQTFLFFPTISSFSKWTLKQDKAKHRKQIGSSWLWL